MNPSMRHILPALVLGTLSSMPAFARILTFEERVRAQEAIERVNYSHQLGATAPFEKAVPRSLLEGKVLATLGRSVALERFWHQPISAEMLQAELDRMGRRTRMPERLEELFRALGNDSFVIQETLVRQVLAERLMQSLSAYDSRIHAGERAAAEDLRHALSRGGKAASSGESRPVEFELVRAA